MDSLSFSEIELQRAVLSQVFLLSFLPWSVRELLTCEGSGHVPKKIEHLRQLPLTTEHRP